ncbi:ribosomal protein s5 [Vairimorpha apis BRL 01]|uniref:Ribosomal protein s5 n=1 Tax=Vairimorpha apis BRL 01 TaxID=1037528 RepID=T0M8Q9_9MICR|nr:ribosomal protein s5 [Vairimorpha apis BRL 01]
MKNIIKDISIIHNHFESLIIKNKIKCEYNNYLLNTKISIYSQHLKAKHLNIKQEILETINQNDILIAKFKNLQLLHSPTEIVDEFMCLIKLINTNHDTLLNILVYIIIKSNIRDLNSLLNFIMMYRRKIRIKCDHVVHIDDGEVDYYLKVFKISLLFIERMEFYDLNISKKEYDNLIK